MLASADIASLTLAAAVIMCMVVVVVLFVLMTSPSATTPLPPFSPLTFDNGLLKVTVLLGRTSLSCVLATATPAATIVTSECEACSLPLFDPSGSGNYTALGIVERLDYSFGAVSATGTLSTDNAVVGRVTPNTPVSACAFDVLGTGSSVTPKSALTFKAFEFVAITSEVGDTFDIVDQLGFSAVLLADSTSANAKQIEELIPSRKYESSVIEGLQDLKLPLVWAVFVSTGSPKLWLGEVPSRCTGMMYSPLVPGLPNAGVPQYRDKGRFYVLEIVNVVVHEASGAVTVVTDAPKLAVVTLGVPNVQVPPGSAFAATLAAATRDAPVGVTIDFAEGMRLAITPAQCFWTGDGGSSLPLYVTMSEASAQGFSTSQDVMTIGAMGLLDSLAVFDIAGQRLGLLQRPPQQ